MSHKQTTGAILTLTVAVFLLMPTGAFAGGAREGELPELSMPPQPRQYISPVNEDGVADELRLPFSEVVVPPEDRVIVSYALQVYDASGALVWSEEDRRTMAAHPRFLGVWNKTDLTATPPPPGFIPLSVETGGGVEALLAEVRRRVLPEDASGAGEPVIESTRQRDLLQRAAGALALVEEAVRAGVSPDAVALDLRDAVGALGEITGEVTSPDVLETMFSHFCVGK